VTQYGYAAGAGWTTIYDEHRHSTGDAGLAKKCKGYKLLLVGARKGSSETFALCAVAPPAVVFKKTEDNTTHEHRGVWWYHCAEAGDDDDDADDDVHVSMGFALSATVELQQADTHNSGHGETNDDEADGRGRLSWHLSSGSGGWRAGLEIELDFDTEWRKVILAR